MPRLKAIIDKLDDVPEALRELYVEREGKFYADFDGIEDVTGLKKNQADLLKEKKALQEKLDAFKDIDPAEFKKLKDEATERDNSKLKAEGKFDELKQKWDQQKAAEIGAVQKQLDEANGKLRKFTLEDRVRAAAVKAGIIPELIDDVLVVTSKRFDLNDKGQIVVLDNDGDPMDVTPDRF